MRSRALRWFALRRFIRLAGLLRHALQRPLPLRSKTPRIAPHSGQLSRSTRSIGNRIMFAIVLTPPFVWASLPVCRRLVPPALGLTLLGGDAPGDLCGRFFIGTPAL